MIANLTRNSMPARRLIVALALVSCFGCTTIRLPQSIVAERKLAAIFQDYFEAYLKLFPTFASEVGDHRYDDQLENAISEAHRAAQRELAQRTLEELQQIDAGQIDRQQRLFYDTLIFNLKDTLEGLKFPQHLLPIRQLASLAVEFPLSRLNSELFRAVRLVVDVGLRRKHWSRAQAIDFIVATTGGSQSGASLEVDRYIAVPAQALGYKIGQLKISAIRAKAEKILGDKFDIRAFHDEFLKDGALPLTILEAKMDHWTEHAGH